MLTNDRKLQHINIVEQDNGVDRRSCHFDKIKLTHRALPDVDIDRVDTSTEFMGKRLSFPLLISSMTGGDHDLIRTVNKRLAEAAEATGVALGVGSQRVMLECPGAKESFMLRRYAPSILMFANLGGVQLNYGYGLEECRDAVEQIDADALCLHLNPLQEAIQVEGNTNFSDLLSKIKVLSDNLNAPVVIKEVGCGVSPQDIEKLISVGITYIDVAGQGGTSWSRIEGIRAGADNELTVIDREVKKTLMEDGLGFRFQDWGIPTPLALKLARPYLDQVKLIASGGLRNGIDMVKSMILGASLCGVASPFIKPAMVSLDSVINTINIYKKEFQTAMFLLGISSVKQLRNGKDLILDNPF